jgi:hypothetical protein
MRAYGVTIFTFLDVIVKIEDTVKEVILDVDDQLDNHNSAAL